MYKIILFLFLTTLLLAKNPSPFAALGNVIYNNAPKIESLKKIDVFKSYSKEIEAYALDVAKVKKEGFALEYNTTPKRRKMYLQQLRRLAKMNDYYTHLVKLFYDNALKLHNSKLFSQLINTGLLDTDEHKKEIIDYYFAHQEEINPKGLIQSYLDEDAKLRAKREAQRKRYKSKQERELERIKEIRERDKREKERLEKRLDEELKKRKRKIREYQKKELSKTI